MFRYSPLLFLAVATLSCSIRPSSSKRQKLNEPTILEVPDDCLCEIFQFVGEGYKKTFELGKVCKNFRHVIDKYPCFLLKKNKNKSAFLHYPTTYSKLSKEPHFKLRNETITKRFISDFGEKGSLFDFENQKIQITIKINKKKSANNCLKFLEGLGNHLKNQKNKITDLKIELTIAKRKARILYTNWPDPESLEIFNKAKITNEELTTLNNLLENIKDLRLFKVDTVGGKEIYWPEKIESLVLMGNISFNSKTLKNIPNLKDLNFGNGNQIKNEDIESFQKLETLRVSEQKEFIPEKISDTLKNLHISSCNNVSLEKIKAKNLEYIEASDCQDLTGKGFLNIKSLQEVLFSNCPKVQINILKKLKTRGCETFNY